MDAKGSVHASEHFFKLENEIFGFRIGSSLACFIILFNVFEKFHS